MKMTRKNTTILTKLLVITLTFVLVTTYFTSCGKNEKVEISADNFSEYFSINVYAENLKVGEVILAYKATCTLHIEIIPLVDLKADNLSVSLELDNNWKVDGNNTIEIKVPESGKITKIVEASSTSVWNYGDNYPTPTAKVISAMGDIFK